ncbi:MAG: hypothetical protein EOO44_00105 [Flavobacterium sp.]|nr:MAG: hypothetical protein EOO44_00105 [Flavobacterium sp.]
MERSQKVVENELIGKTIAKIEFENLEDQSDLSIKAIYTQDGFLYKIENGITTISHPESEQEKVDFFKALEKVTPGGLVTFNAKHLSDNFIEEEIKKKAKEIGANGWGRAGSHNHFSNQVSYRFDMPQ